MTRLIALDYGSKRIGIAISDPLQLFARPYKTVIHNKLSDTLLTLQEIIRLEEVSKIIVGLPYHYDGAESPQTEQEKHFIAELKKHVNIPIETFDERYSSQEAVELFAHKKIKLDKKNKELIDQMAATVILQGYLDAIHNENK